MKHVSDLIKQGHNEQLAQKLEQDPSLAGKKTEQGFSLLQLAAYYRNTEAVAILRSHITRLDIFEAAMLGDVQLVAQLLDEEPERLDRFSADGFTPLGLSAYFGQFDVVTELLKQNADPIFRQTTHSTLRPCTRRVPYRT